MAKSSNLRQRMINLMYLVFIGMLALNVSKEVLTAFGLINESLKRNNDLIGSNNEAFYKGLETKAASNQQKFGPLLKTAKEVREESATLYSYIESLKGELLANMSATNYESMDQSTALDNKFFSASGLSNDGNTFVSMIETYKSSLTSKLTDEKFSDLKSRIEKIFSTADVTDQGGVTKSWLEYKFKEFPLVASITNLTKIQTDIKNTESDILATMLGEQLEAEVSPKTFQAMVILDKSAYFQGEQVTGKVVLGKYDETITPSVSGVNATSTQGGVVTFSQGAGGVGQQTISGSLSIKDLDNKVVSLPFSQKYEVISKPGEAVVSATKMNILYRGVQNPISVSMPGVPSNSISVSGPVSRVGDGKYMADVSGSGESANIVVSGKLPSGETISSTTTFRVKSVPPPMGTVRGETQPSMPASSLKQSTIGAEIPGFEFDVSFNVNEFSIKIPGQPTIVCSGNRLSGQAQAALDRVRPGEVVTINNIKTTMSNNPGIKIPQASPVVVTIR